jgi:ferritin-like metal-binding protein YciE
MDLNTIEDVYAAQLATLRSVESQLQRALPGIDEVDEKDQKLTKALDEHAGRLERQIERLDQVIAASPIEIPDDTSKPAQSMLAEVKAIVGSNGPPEVRDAALVAALQRIAHFEIATYGTARALADQIGIRDGVDLLGETLSEKVEFDELLTKLATGGLIVSGLNERAQS